MSKFIPSERIKIDMESPSHVHPAILSPKVNIHVDFRFPRTYPGATRESKTSIYIYIYLVIFIYVCIYIYICRLIGSAAEDHVD